MRRHLALCGKWLAGTGGVTALGYLVATEAAGGRHPVWPYWLFGVMLAVGLLLYLMCQDGMKRDRAADDDRSQHDDSPIPRSLQVNLAGDQAMIFAVQNGIQRNDITNVRDGQGNIEDGRGHGGSA